MVKVHLDFESRSRVDIWSTGAYVYSRDPSTEIMCLAYAVGDGPVKIIPWSAIQMYPLIDPFEELRSLAENKEHLFYAHNALFEQLIWRHKLTQYGLPNLPINRWRCTAAKALTHGLPKSLADAAFALGCTQKKDLLGRSVMLKVCIPKTDGTWNEDPDLIAQLENYCAQDVRAEREIDQMLPELHPSEQIVWFEDQLINQRGIEVDREALGKCLSLIEKETELLKEQIVSLTDGVLDGVSRRDAVLAYFKKHKVNLPDFTKQTVQTALDTGILPAHLTQVLRIRQQLGLTSTAKYIALQEAIGHENRLRDILVYHSATTGRWGGKTVQLQNLPKGTIQDTTEAVENIKSMDLEDLRFLYGNVMGLLSSCLRGMFISAPGYDLIVADYSAIEARVLMWFCGQKDAVEMFASGKDIYIAMAKVIYGKDKIEKNERQLGKQVVLGCGYGCGVDKFKATCATYGIKITDELAERAVTSYRTTYKNVVSTWYNQERAMKTAISTGKKVSCNAVDWIPDKRFLYCELPSGRRLAYHKARIENDKIKYMATNSVTKHYGWSDTYSSRIVENIIQAIARDILAHAMVNAERNGYKIVLTVHDELVAEVKENEKSVEEFIKIITELPAWAKGCPINAEGWRGKRYKK